MRDSSAPKPTEKTVQWRYSEEIFRPEAVDAFMTRQAGEPWDAKHPFEGLLVLGLTILGAAALTLLLLGGH
jgi:hypothetical protein